MQRKIGTNAWIGDTVSPFDSITKSYAINRSESNYTNAREKVQKIKQLILTGTYDSDIGTLDLTSESILEDIDWKEKAAHIS